MLIKLLKYDLKWIYKVLIVFYILTILFSTLGRLLSMIENSIILNVIGQICLGTSVTMIINILINNFMRVWARFTRNMYKDEAYLTHTLPINKSTLYLSKFLSAIITMITSFLVIIIALFIAYYSKETLEVIKNSLESIALIYESSIADLLSIVFIVLLLELIYALVAGYLGIIIGHKSNNRKIVKSIIYGFIVFIIPSVLTLITLFVIGVFNPTVMNFFKTTEQISISALKSILYIGIIMYICYIFIYYLICNKLLKKGVDID